MNCSKCGKRVDGPGFTITSTTIEYFEEEGNEAIRELPTGKTGYLCSKCCPVTEKQLK